MNDITLDISLGRFTFTGPTDDAAFVQMFIYPAKDQLLVKPCSEEACNSVSWVSPNEGQREISSNILSDALYRSLHWYPIFNYRLKCTGINSEQMYVFDLKSADPWKEDPFNE